MLFPSFLVVLRQWTHHTQIKILPGILLAICSYVLIKFFALRMGCILSQMGENLVFKSVSNHLDHYSEWCVDTRAWRIGHCHIEKVVVDGWGILETIWIKWDGDNGSFHSLKYINLIDLKNRSCIKLRDKPPASSTAHVSAELLIVRLGQGYH